MIEDLVLIVAQIMLVGLMVILVTAMLSLVVDAWRDVEK